MLRLILPDTLSPAGDAGRPVLVGPVAFSELPRLSAAWRWQWLPDAFFFSFSGLLQAMISPSDDAASLWTPASAPVYQQTDTRTYSVRSLGNDICAGLGDPVRRFGGGYYAE